MLLLTYVEITYLPCTGQPFINVCLDCQYYPPQNQGLCDKCNHLGLDENSGPRAIDFSSSRNNIAGTTERLGDSSDYKEWSLRLSTMPRSVRGVFFGVVSRIQSMHPLVHSAFVPTSPVRQIGEPRIAMLNDDV